MAKRRKTTKTKKKPLSSSSCSTSDKVSDEKNIEGNENVDRLSVLPEEVLHHIFSIFDMTEVVRLSVLSKFWWRFWKTLPVIQFSANDFSDENYHDDKDEYDLYATFENCVEKILRIRKKNPIHTFNVFLYYLDESIYHIRSWIRNIVMRNVQHLCLTFENPDYVKLLDLPHSLFSCKSLTSLELTLSLNPGTWLEVPLPDSIDLPRLKSLNLQSVCKMNTEFLNKFFLGCPVLENLYITFCEFDESTHHLIISSLQLKDLLIQRCFHVDDPYGFKITVSTPNLTSFTCGDLHVTDLYIENLSSLETAKLDMARRTREERYEEAKGKIGGRIVKCLKVLYNVKSLTLDYCALKEVSKALDISKRSGISFDNLRSLNVAVGIGKDYMEAAKYIFEISTKVERLEIELFQIDESSASNASYMEEEFSLKNVKYIEVEPIKGFVYELDLLKNLLKFAVTLEKMAIITSKKLIANKKGKLKAFRDELGHAQASSTAKVSFIAGYH